MSSGVGLEFESLPLNHQDKIVKPVKRGAFGCLCRARHSTLANYDPALVE
jgi:hypothetical protein